MTRVMGELRELLGDDAAVTFGSGNHTAWGHWYFPTRVYPSQFSVRNGTMGYSVPAAAAVSLQFPERTVVAVAGDGEFQMNGHEPATAVQAGARFPVLVMDNGQDGTIRSHQEAHYPGRVSGTQLVNPDFAALARGYGAHGATLDDDSRIAAVLREALTAVESGLPAVVHVMVDRSLVLPQPDPAD
ncbi:thiamine pyrophosphate-dependent enzyme [Corynebacterium sp. 335C]